MRTTTAIHAATVLRWALGLPVNGQPASDDDARHAAIELARAAHAVLPTDDDLAPVGIAAQWDDGRPRVITGPAYTLRADPDEIRRYYTDDDCLDCRDGICHGCSRSSTDGLSDDQLVRAAEKVLSGATALDDGIGYFFDHVVSVAGDLAIGDAVRETAAEASRAAAGAAPPTAVGEPATSGGPDAGRSSAAANDGEVRVEELPVAELQDGDVFSLDGGVHWYVCAEVMPPALCGRMPVYRDDRRDPHDPDTEVVRIPARFDEPCAVLRGPWVAVGSADQPTVLPFDRATGQPYTLATARLTQWEAAQRDVDVWILQAPAQTG